MCRRSSLGLAHSVWIAATANLAGNCVCGRFGLQLLSVSALWRLESSFLQLILVHVSLQHRQWIRRGFIRLPEQTDCPVHEETKGNQQVPHEEVSPAAEVCCRSHLRV